MSKTTTTTKSASSTKPGWILTYRKTGYSRRFPTLQAARERSGLGALRNPVVVA